LRKAAYSEGWRKGKRTPQHFKSRRITGGEAEISGKGLKRGTDDGGIKASDRPLAFIE